MINTPHNDNVQEKSGQPIEISTLTPPTVREIRRLKYRKYIYCNPDIPT